jgi:hypothetical protein
MMRGWLCKARSAHSIALSKAPSRKMRDGEIDVIEVPERIEGAQSKSSLERFNRLIGPVADCVDASFRQPGVAEFGFNARAWSTIVSAVAGSPTK